jgi:hypothetical protein
MRLTVMGWGFGNARGGARRMSLQDVSGRAVCNGCPSEAGEETDRVGRGVGDAWGCVRRSSLQLVSGRWSLYCQCEARQKTDHSATWRGRCLGVRPPVTSAAGKWAFVCAVLG